MVKVGIIYCTPQIWDNDPKYRSLIAERFAIRRLEYSEWKQAYQILITGDELSELREGMIPPQYDISFKSENGETFIDKIEKV